MALATEAAASKTDRTWRSHWDDSKPARNEDIEGDFCSHATKKICMKIIYEKLEYFEIMCINTDSQ